MTRFETIEKYETQFGNNNFVQVSHKVAHSDDSSSPFVALTRGYLDGQGSRRYKTNLTLPAKVAADADLLEWVAEGLKAHAKRVRESQPDADETDDADAIEESDPPTIR